MDELIINAKMDTKGFEAGTKRLASAIKSFGSNVDRSMKSIQGAGKSVLSTIMKWGPALLGVGGAYSIISKSVSAFMSQNQQLQGTLTSCWTAIGNMLGPIITSIVNMIATVVSYLVTFLNLLGLTTKTASQAGQKASGAAQQLKKQLMGFDELNVMQDNQGGGGAGGGLQDIEPNEWMQKLAELLKSKMWDEAADMIIDGMNNLIYTFKDKAFELGDKIGEYLGGALHIIARVLDEVDWHALGEGLANFVNGIINHIDGEDLGKLIVAKFTIMFKMLTGFLETLNWERLGLIISDAIVSAINAVERAINQADFKKIGAGIRKFFEQIDWQAIRDAIFGVLESAWNAALDLLWGLIAGESKEEPPIIGALRDLGKAAKDLFEKAVPHLQKVIDKILEFSGSAIKTAVDELTSLFKNLADLLSGQKTFAEFWGDLSPIQSNIALIAASMTTIKAVLTAKTFFDAIGNFLFKTQGAAAAAETAVKGVSTAAGEAAAGVGKAASGVELSAGGVLTLVGTAMVLTNTAIKENQQYQNEVDKTVAELERQAAASTGIASEIYKLSAEYERARGVMENWSSTTGNQIGAAIKLKESYDGLVTASKDYAASIGDITSEEKAIQAYGELCKAIDMISASRDEYHKKGLNTKELDEILSVLIEQQTEIQKQYNLTLSEQSEILDKTEQTMEDAADASQRGAQASQDAASATTQAKDALLQEKEAMEQAKQASENMVAQGNELINKMGDVAESGEASASELTAGYTNKINEKAPEMSKATQDAGSEAGKSLEDGVKEVSPSEVAEEFMDEFKTGIETHGTAASEAAKSVAKDTVTAVRDEVQIGTQEINSVVESSVGLITNTVQNCESLVRNAISGTRNNVTQSFNAMSQTVSSSMKDISDIISTVFNNLIQISGQAGVAIANNFANGMTQLYNSAANVAVELNGMLGSYFGQIAQNGYVWGHDLGILFNNGLVDACNAYLIPTLSQVAQSIKNVIGFSKPKEGPLSDADTYMPDFMQLLTKGVEENMDKPLEAVADLADGVRGELADGDYTFGDFEAGELDTAFSAFGTQFLEGFGALVDRLDAIAERVTYALPDVAAGAVLPYSVGMGTGQEVQGGGANLSDVLSAIDSLKTFLTASGGESQGLSVNVFLDSEQIENAVTVRQRRRSMARGV